MLVHQRVTMVANSCLSQAAEDVAVFPFEAIPTLQQNPRGEMRHTPSCCGCCGSCQERCEIICQWIGLRENLQENPIFNGTIYGFRLRFSLKPIHWIWELAPRYGDVIWFNRLMGEGGKFLLKWWRETWDETCWISDTALGNETWLHSSVRCLYLLKTWK
jgi:hypothetical protein